MPRGDTRSIDDRHDELRAIDSMLMQLEDQQPDAAGVVVTGETAILHDVVHAGAREALQRLHDAHDRYRGHAAPARDVLLKAAETAEAWLHTLVSFDRVDNGPDE